MARKKAVKKEIASATLPSGSKVTASPEVIAKLTGKAPAKKAAAKPADEK